MSFAIKSGRITELVMIIISLLIVYVFIRLAHRKFPEFRSIPAMDSLDDIFGRAAEMEKPVHFSAGGAAGGGGVGKLGSSRGGLTLFAGYSVLSEAADKAAKLKSPFFVTGNNIEGLPLITEIMENAYRRAGALDSFNPTEQIIVNTPFQWAWQALVFDLFHEKQIAGNILLGGQTSAAEIAEVAAQMGAVQLGNAGGTGGIAAYVAAVADYVFLGPEMVSAGAILSKEVDQAGSIIGGDAFSLMWLAILVVGVITKTLGSNIITDLLKL